MQYLSKYFRTIIPLVYLMFLDFTTICEGNIAIGKFKFTEIVSQSDNIGTMATFELSPFMTKRRCAKMCIDEKLCLAIEICGPKKSGQCRLSNGSRSYFTAISGSSCKRFQRRNPETGNGSILESTTPNFSQEEACSDCDCLSSFETTSGIYNVTMKGQHVKVYCSLEGNLAWTVFQRMFGGSEDFSRPWSDYVKGFGDLLQEFWLGSEILHLLTTSGNSVLRVDMVDHNGRTTYAEYSTFLVANASTNYTITAYGYSGTAGDGEGATWDTWTQITKYLIRSEMKVRRDK